MAVRTSILACVGFLLFLAGPALPADPSPPSFRSSFEAGDPQPDWTDAVEVDAAGVRRASGVDGEFTAGMPGEVTEQVVGIAASGEYARVGEVKENLLDGDPGSKWLVQTATGWIRLELSEPTTVTGYALTSANDAAERDPRDWSFEGSADGREWIPLDARSAETFAERLDTREFRVARPAPYAWYRLDISGNAGADLTQLADLHLLVDAASLPQPPPDMTSRIDPGPRSSPTAKPRVGFTGLRTLAYAGTHVAEERGYSVNKVFRVNIPVGPATELSYLVFPELTGGDLSYRSTYVALDLAFTDGTYLSELGAVDQHGVRVDAVSQGESKTLYTGQWNYKRSAIGAVAAGKTIARILVAYDDPRGSGPFRGWIDDVRIGDAAPAPDPKHLADLVVTTRGTQSTWNFSRGNNIPATAVPNGFNFWVPMTNAGSTSWLYEYHRTNDAENLPELQAFTVTHEPSPWMGDRQTFQVMPSAAPGVPDADRAVRALAFRHENEEARPYLYRVTFENGVRVEIAPTDHAAVFRFTFPGEDACVLFDNVNDNGGLTLDPAQGTLGAFSDVRSRLSAGATRCFIHAEFDRPVTASGLLPGGGGSHVTGYFRFAAGAERNVTMRIATSLLGVEQAEHNLALEIPAGEGFEAVAARARDAWDQRLGVIELEGATEDQLTTFYSCLYRLFLYPNSGFENTGAADDPAYVYASPFSPPLGENTPTHTGARVVSGKVYVNNGFWDTFRTVWPAYALFAPKLAGELVDGFVQQFNDGGWIARWSSPGYADLMAGTSSDVAFADAYVKGVSFNAPAAYRAAVKNASVVPPDPSVGRKGLETSIFLGYTSTETEEGTSWALDGCVNDFGIGNMARALAADSDTPAPDRQRYREEAVYYLDRALRYVNHFDRAVGFFQGRAEDGTWRLSPAQYDPRVWGYDYTETDGWNFAFTAPHDGNGLARLYGWKPGVLAAKLDTFFAVPETADPAFAGSYGGVIHEMTEARDVRMGQYGHSNQVSHHIPYMYDYAGQPWKTQAKVREILSRCYLGSEIGQGYPGDEDNGEMSAWYIFSALGFYPLQVGSPRYVLGSPLFPKVIVHQENGNTLVVRAHGQSRENVYVQSVRIDGQAHDKTWVDQGQVAGETELDFYMGPEPSSWGANEPPPSPTGGMSDPVPRRDFTGEDGAVFTADSGGDVAGLFDDTSKTRVRFPGATFRVTAHLPGEPAKADYYTLTSAETEGDPRSWVLKGSKDGKSWMTLDERAGETFTWRLYTRPFRIAHPDYYAYYRLSVTETTGEPATGLAEIELLGYR